MSEDLNFKIARDFIEMLKRKGITEVPFEDLTETLKKIAESVGYHEDDTIPVLKLEEYLYKYRGNISSVPQFLTVPQTPQGKLNMTSSVPQLSSTNIGISEEDRILLREQVSPYLQAISKVIEDQIWRDRTKNSCFALKPFKNFVLKLSVLQEFFNKSIYNVLESNVSLEFSTPLPFEFHQFLLILRSNSHKFSPRHFTLTPTPEEKTTSISLLFNFFDSNNLHNEEIPLINTKEVPDFLGNGSSTLLAQLQRHDNLLGRTLHEVHLVNNRQFSYKNLTKCLNLAKIEGRFYQIFDENRLKSYIPQWHLLTIDGENRQKMVMLYE